MKIPEKSKEKMGKVKHKQIPKAKKEHVLIVAQEIKFARLLSGNEKKTRDRVLKSLKKWLLNCFDKNYEFKEDDFIRVWKGLFYAVWMSDKPLVQEELCESIAGILDVFPADQLQNAMLMTKAGFRVLATEWYGIDQHRMDKFLMLVRRYLRGSLRVLRRSEWSLDACQLFSNMLSSNDGLLSLKTPHYARNALSMQLHVVDCFLEELSKVSSGSIAEAGMVELVRPFCEYTCSGSAPALCGAARRLLTALLRQSALGLRHQHAAAAWRQMGCPEGGPEALELVTDDDDDDDGQDDGDDDMDNGDDSARAPLDPRAGRVDVVLAPLPVPARQLAALLRALLPAAASRAHHRLRICMERFERLARDEYPLPETMQQPEITPQPPRGSARDLLALEKTLLAHSDELALRGLSRKHRKRLLAKSRGGASIVGDAERLHRHAPTHATNGDWQVETTEPEPKKIKMDTSNKENRDKKKRKREGNDARAAKKRDATGKRRDNVENGKKVAENSKKVVENVKKITDNSQEHADKSPKPLGKNKSNNNVVENGIKKSNKTVASENNTKIATKVISDSKQDINNAATTKRTKKSLQKQQNITDTVVLKEKTRKSKNETKATVVVNKIKHFQKQSKKLQKFDRKLDTPKTVKFELKNNSMQGAVDYYRSVRQSPSIPYDGTRQPTKTNLKPSTPSPINPFFKRKLKLSSK